MQGDVRKHGSFWTAEFHKLEIRQCGRSDWDETWSVRQSPFRTSLLLRKEAHTCYLLIINMFGLASIDLQDMTPTEVPFMALLCVCGHKSSASLCPFLIKF